MAALKKKKAAFVEKAAFKDGPDHPGLKHSAEKEH